MTHSSGFLRLAESAEPTVQLKVRMEVEVVETLEDVKVNRITDVRTYGLPDGWTMAQVRDLLLKNGFKQ